MRNEKDSFDYRKVNVKRSMVSLYTEAYRYFGWILICSDPDEPNQASGTWITLEFRRDHKIRNKAELTRLQRNFDACVDEICEMEKEKTGTADKAARGIGLMGSLFLICSALLAFACKLSAGILLAIPGVFGWLFPGFLHKRLVKKKSEEVDPLIEQKYDEIQRVCQKADGLTDYE